MYSGKVVFHIPNVLMFIWRLHVCEHGKSRVDSSEFCSRVLTWDPLCHKLTGMDAGSDVTCVLVGWGTV